MTYKVAIRKNETGEIRFSTVDWDWYQHGDDGDLWWWTEGNSGCDCNRHLYFERACGHDPDADEGYESVCSEDKYTALYAELPDGTKITLDEVE